MDIPAYLAKVRALHASGQSTEHSFRPALAELFSSIDSGVTVINEPRRTVDVGAPDFVFARDGISVGWCEAKDIGKDIRKFAANDYSREQKARYTKGLPNLIYTNGLDFEFIVKGEVTGFVSIADAVATLPARPDQFDRLQLLLRDFASQTPISITTAKHLAQMMAAKAALIKDIMGNALTADSKAGIGTELTDQYEGFKTSLIHDITIADFADVYAETIAYGLFAARLHDTSMDSFNRAEALELLPKSNPFLRNLFVYIAGPNLDDRLRRTIDDLCEVFRACDVAALMQDFGKFTARNDPFLHFYETFLAEYNPAKRKARGVWYTPEPVVNFIVRAVDDVLKTEFGLPMGLADTSKISIDWDSGQNDPKTGKPVMTKKDVHRVQILDPATGTGTFLAEAIKQIAAQVKDVAPAMWSSYVERDLIPRLHGFELLMASYAMCHMKLDMMLTDMGYKPSVSPPRLGVYLTNSLEEGERVEQTLPFARWLSEEAKGANTIKRDTPIMCVIGNPPYSISSSNQGSWIKSLIEDYKKVDERNLQPLNDDYVKFLRFSEYMIAKNGEGILGFITNHGYLDNPTFRGMRKHILKTFDKVFILDLHGNANKQEASPDGGIDQNVFDIRQGVSIILAIKKHLNANADAKVWHSEIWGNRSIKNAALWEMTLASPDFEQLKPYDPYYFFDRFNGDATETYNLGFNVADLFGEKNTGIKTHRDHFVIDIDRNQLQERMKFFLSDQAADDELASKFAIKNSPTWSINFAKKSNFFRPELLQRIEYRIFDYQYIYYDLNMIDRHRYSTARHMVSGENISLLCPKMTADGFDVSVTKHLSSNKTASRYDQSYFFPLYLYPEVGTLETERRVNFDPKIYAEIRERAGLDQSPSSSEEGLGVVAERSEALAVEESSGAQTRATTPSPSFEKEGLVPDELLVFDYIYGVLHSPDYRRTYAQFLKIDFPRIPYPASPEVFAHVAEKGGQLRRLHLMEDAAIGATPFPFMGDGDNVVVKPAFSSSPLLGRGGSSVAAEGEGESNGSQTSSGSNVPPARSWIAGGNSPLNSPSPNLSPEGERGRVHINRDQYFDNVPAVAWEFHIGGYQPAQKWLKDRKGRALSFDDVRHYQKIIKILCETDRIMQEIELPL